MLIHVICLSLSFVVGLAAGLLYFGGLWLTVRRVHRVRRPVLLTLGSFFGRLAVTVVVFYLVARGGHWARLVASLAGFLVMRFLLTRHWRPEAEDEEVMLKNGHKP